MVRSKIAAAFAALMVTSSAIVASPLPVSSDNSTMWPEQSDAGNAVDVDYLPYSEVLAALNNHRPHGSPAFQHQQPTASPTPLSNERMATTSVPSAVTDATVTTIGSTVITPMSLGEITLSLTPETNSNEEEDEEPMMFTPQPPPPVFVLPPPPPSHHHPYGTRWGPYFEDGPGPENITARVSSTVRLDCRIVMLHDKTVMWLHHSSGGQMRLLTVGRHTYSSDQRMNLSFRYPNNWRLEIMYVQRRDAGLYECQVATHPPMVRRVHLSVTAPKLRIIGDAPERYYKADSGVELVCLATLLEGPGDRVTWMHGLTPVEHGVLLNTSLEAQGTLLSTLKIAQAQKEDSGNYTCAVGELASATVTVHVLNGELPAAVHDGNGAAVWWTSPPLAAAALALLLLQGR